jgi:hypothetical protein
MSGSRCWWVVAGFWIFKLGSLINSSLTNGRSCVTQGRRWLGTSCLMPPQLSKLVLIRDAYAYPKQVVSTVANVTLHLIYLWWIADRWLLASTKALPAERLGLYVDAYVAFTAACVDTEFLHLSGRWSRVGRTFRRASRQLELLVHQPYGVALRYPFR